MGDYETDAESRSPSKNLVSDPERKTEKKVTFLDDYDGEEKAENEATTAIKERKVEGEEASNNSKHGNDDTKFENEDTKFGSNDTKLESVNTNNESEEMPTDLKMDDPLI